MARLSLLFFFHSFVAAMYFSEFSEYFFARRNLTFSLFRSYHARARALAFSLSLSVRFLFFLVSLRRLVILSLFASLHAFSQAACFPGFFSTHFFLLSRAQMLHLLVEKNVLQDLHVLPGGSSCSIFASNLKARWARAGCWDFPVSNRTTSVCVDRPAARIWQRFRFMVRGRATPGRPSSLRATD